ncbi:MAG: hypothetical protein ACK5RG_02325 [Cyclobacteriaceae bacterium]|jgi:uncharacterized membrane protein YphA (DoxX/SURF4 family)|nr:hypothetical protein [Flammeovirgaceae bacterium]
MEVNLINQSNTWQAWHRVLFRFLFAYIFLYCFSFPFFYIPGAHVVIHPIGSLLQDLSVWYGTNVWGYTNVPTEETGSGDTLLYWLLWATKLTLAILVTFIWSVIDRKRQAYPWLKKLLLTYTRYYLALILLSYGLFKMVPTQFEEPSARMLVQMYGESSPMGLLWNFMGYSTAYQIFGGVAEVLGAVLLLFRRTTLLGALILVGVMANVVILNYCFDVPVKLASTHYLLFSMGLAFVYGKPVTNLLLLNRATEPMDQTPLFEKKRWFWGTQITKLLLVGFVFYSMLSAALAQKSYTDTLKHTSAMGGVFDVIDFSRKSSSDSIARNYRYYWHRMVLDKFRPDKLVVQQINGTKVRYQIAWDTVAKQVTGYVPEDSLNRIELHYESTTKSKLKWKGVWRDDSVRMITKRFETDSMLLKTRGFRWVNPIPFNR